MEPFLIVAAFIFGAVSNRFGLPPLVGYLIAGSVLNSFGMETSDLLETIADWGVTLLLFTIGLKLKLKNLSRPEVWAGATIHMLITVTVFWVGIWGLSMAGATYFNLLNWQTAVLIAFALSFSSTVFAVKVLEGKKEIGSRHAATAIGILIIQDIIAVIFLTISAGKLPSPWSVALIVLLVIIKPLLLKVLSRCGHGELLMLFGVLMTITGFTTFEMVNLKGDLGALIFGMILTSHPKSDELGDRLLGFKDLFLVGFFLNIGISGTPSIEGFVVALFLAFVMLFKAILFFGLLTRFRLRARTSMLASLSLANYSEFGLIVGSIGVANGWISADWLLIIGIALSITFVLAAPLNSAAHTIYARLSDRLRHFETKQRLPEDAPIETGDADVAVIGMGALGASAYDEMQRRYGNVVIGVDFCSETVEAHLELERNVVYGDAEDSDFWQRLVPGENNLKLIMLALPDPQSSIFAVRELKNRGYSGQISASVRYDDEIMLLKQEGVNAAYSLFEEAGVGFAEHVCAHMNYCKQRDD